MKVGKQGRELEIIVPGNHCTRISSTNVDDSKAHLATENTQILWLQERDKKWVFCYSLISKCYEISLSLEKLSRTVRACQIITVYHMDFVLYNKNNPPPFLTTSFRMYCILIFANTTNWLAQGRLSGIGWNDYFRTRFWALGKI